MEQGVFRTTLLLVMLLLSCASRSEAQALSSGNPDVSSTRVDIFAGYSYWSPYAADIAFHYYKPINLGAVGSAAVYFNRWLGVQVEGGYHPNGPNDCAFTGEAGPIVRAHFGRLVPFAHVLAGGVKIGGPVLNPCTWGYGATGGVGMDYVLPAFHDRIAIRILQLDYQYNYVDYGPLVAPGLYTGGIAKLQALRGSAGMVFRFGEKHNAEGAQMSCIASPSHIFPGDPVTVGSQILYIDVRRPMDYTWTTTGGKISGRGDAINIDTNGLSPGTYKVSGTVQQGRGALHRASCETDFTVKSYEPPTITCSANPSTIRVGETSTITATGVSPSGRKMTFTFSTSAGQLSPSGSVATLATGGVPPGDVTVSCMLMDDQGKSATSVTNVNIQAVAIPPSPQQRSLCSVGFDRDHRRPARVDNEAKGCLDDIALTMNRESGAQLVIVGNHGLDEGAPTAEERAVNVKQYLTTEKGVDASRIQVRVGTAASGHTAENILVPAGATLLGEGTRIVDEKAVVRHGVAYGAGRKATTRASNRSRSTRRKTQTKTPAVPAYQPPER
jgi:hypothetical protein